jgi:O-antigen ligase
MILLSAALVFLSIGQRFPWKDIYNNPLFLLILLQFALYTFNIGVSTAPFLSLKYLLSKIWFIFAFVFMTVFFLKDQKIGMRVIALLIGASVITTLYTIIRHAGEGFSFEEVNAVGKPFYLNHVTFGTFTAMIFPFAVALYFWKRKHPWHGKVILVAIALFLFGIITSYTRATWLSMIVAILALVIFRFRLVKQTMILGSFVALLGVLYLIDDNRYISLAPNYQKTVFNRDDLGKHMEATVELSDVSGMERIYRWVAAINMIKENFWLGTGNNTFYPLYKDYVNPAFVTYVSDNPERSTTHNYFLLLFCDQGVFGFLLFTIFFLMALVKAENLYYKTSNAFLASLLLAIFSSLIILLVHLALSDMIEVDKTGGLFYFCIGLLIVIENQIKSEHQLSNQSPSVEEKMLKE